MCQAQYVLLMWWLLMTGNVGVTQEYGTVRSTKNGEISEIKRRSKLIEVCHYNSDIWTHRKSFNVS